MNQAKAPDYLLLKFEGKADDKDEIPASILTQVLEAFQRTIYLLAMEKEKKGVRLKDRTSRQIETNFAVMFSAPKAGSLSLTAKIGDPTSDLFKYDAGGEIIRMYQDVSGAITAGDTNKLSEILPDELRRRKILEAFLSTIPKSGSGIDFRVTNGTLHPLFESRMIEKSLRELISPSENEEDLRIVTGQLAKIDFIARKITLIYPLPKRQLNCFYIDSLEPLLLENRRQFIQVYGKVIPDQEGNPMEITDVESIKEVDLSPFYLATINHSGLELKFRSPINLKPKFDETKQLLCLQHEELGIYVFAHTREELNEELHAQIAFLWCTYAKGQFGEMTLKAQALGKYLRDSLEEVSNQ